MSALRTELREIARALLAASEDSRTVALDDVGSAIGDLAVTHDEIDALISELEAQGRTVSGPRPGAAAEHLRRVLPAARALTLRTGKKPSPEALARETGLTVDEVRGALALGRVLGR